MAEIQCSHCSQAAGYSHLKVKLALLSGERQSFKVASKMAFDYN